MDGKETPIFKTNFLFRGLELAAGKHIVRFFYHAQTFPLGALISLISLIILIITAVRGKGAVQTRSERADLSDPSIS